MKIISFVSQLNSNTTKLSFNRSKYFIIPILALLVVFSAHAQNGFESGFNFGFQVGGSKLLGEMSSSTGTIKEFNNQFGTAFAFEVSKFISPHFEAGFNMGFSHLTGNINDPLELSAQGFHDAFPPPPNRVSDPLEYSNKLLKPNLLLRFYVFDISNQKYFNPYLKVGMGYLTYRSDLKYIDTQEIIYGKGNENFANLSTGAFIFGTGFISNLSEHFYVNTSVDFNVVNYDFLDVVHNYDSEGNRLQLKGLFTELRIGIFYSTKSASGGSKSSGKRGKSKGKIMPASNRYLPFAR